MTRPEDMDGPFLSGACECMGGDSGGAVVGVEYDSRGKRVVKQFDDAWEARRFYVGKDRDGKRPRVVRADGGGKK